MSCCIYCIGKTGTGTVPQIGASYSLLNVEHGLYRELTTFQENLQRPHRP